MFSCAPWNILMWIHFIDRAAFFGGGWGKHDNCFPPPCFLEAHQFRPSGILRHPRERASAATATISLRLLYSISSSCSLRTKTSPLRNACTRCLISEQIWRAKKRCQKLRLLDYCIIVALQLYSSMSMKPRSSFIVSIREKEEKGTGRTASTEPAWYTIY